MISRFSLLLFCLIGLSVSKAKAQFDQKPIADQIQNMSFDELSSTPLLTLSPEQDLNSFDLTNQLRSAVIHQVDQNEVKSLLVERPQLLSLAIPLDEERNMELHLYKANIFSDEFRVIGSDNQELGYPLESSIHYWGIVKNQFNSLAAISISNDELMGFVSVEGRKYTLGLLPEIDRNIFYEESDLLIKNNFICGTDEEYYIGLGNRSNFDPDRGSSSTGPSNCVGLYLEVDNDIVVNKGGVTQATNYINGVFSQVAILYANDAINFTIEEMKVWDVVDPYTGSSPSSNLIQFRNHINGVYNGDLAHLVSLAAPGGVAYVDVLCNSYYGVAYSGIYTNYNNVPLYSWTINVITHEIGHNLGSYHTHDCVWGPNNNEPIDCCAQNSGYSSNICGTNYNCTIPTPPAGTIMSYCHLSPNNGIDFNLGFGPEPGDLLRDKVYNASCLTSCPSCANNGGDNDGDGYCADVDCDDNNSAINPGATEVCDGVDNNCDGNIDEGVLITFYFDGDSDGYGNPNVSTQNCNAPNGYVNNNGDCDDSNAAINPGMQELCNDGVDNNCSGVVDEGCGACTYETINFNNFDNNWGIWNDGGSDCRRSSRDSQYAIGQRCVRLRDNTNSSVMTTDNIDLSGYDEITVDFTYYPRSMDNSNEDFWFQISSNGGASYTTYEEWNRGDEFVNNQRYWDAVVVSGPFTSNSRLRFRCDASGNSDWVYIDEVTISGCLQAGNRSSGEDALATATETENRDATVDQIVDFKVFPNPAKDVLNISFENELGGIAKIQLFDLEGKSWVKQIMNYEQGLNNMKIDLQHIPVGTYFLSLTTDEQQKVSKLIIF